MMESLNDSSSCGQFRPRHLLVVEDEAADRVLLNRVLSTLGYSVRVAENASEAVRLADAEPFDLVLSDIGLPDRSGYELMADLRDRFSMKGIALTGYGMDAEIRLGREAGFCEHIVKPVDIVQLEDAIRRVLNLRSSPTSA